MSDQPHATGSRAAMTAVWAERDEFWPWYDLHDGEPDFPEDAPVEIPTELWDRYRETSRLYWKLKNEILLKLGLRDG